MIPIRTLAEIARNNLDVETATVRAALLKNTTEYSPDADTHNFVDDVLDGGTTGAEYDDTNYSRQSVTNVAITEDNTDTEVVIDCDDVTWSSLGSATGGQTVEAVLFYVQIGGDDATPGDDPILRIFDDSEETDLEKQTNGEDFTWQINSEGLINLTP